METIEDEYFDNQTVEMDGKRFIGCTFTNCRLLFAGGKVFWERSSFANCQLAFTDAAQRTLLYLLCFGHRLGSENIDDVVGDGGSSGPINMRPKRA